MKNASLGSHHHLIDEETGEIINFRDNALEAAIASIALSLGYRVAGQTLLLTGQRIGINPEDHSGQPAQHLS